MRKNLLQRAGALALSAALALTMCSASAFAAGGAGAYSSADTDYLKNGTGNSTAVRQNNAAYTVWEQNDGASALIGADSGVITLGKILNVNQKNKFPDIEDFVYKVTPVSAWDNANIDTDKSGAPLSREDMPKPDDGRGNSHHQAVYKGSGEDWFTLVTLGNFKENESNTSTVTNSDAASNTDGIDEKYRKTRTTDLKFTFTKAGYYMYKVEEVGSIGNGSPITSDPVALRKDVAGVDYDNNTYYVVFYVANTQAEADSSDPAPDEYGHGVKKGDTVGAEQGDEISGGARAGAGGVYVHTITSWTNSQSTDHKAADLQDSQALSGAKDLMNNMDNGGNAADKNTGKVDGNNNGVTSGDSTVTHDNLGKVGSSIPGTPPPSPNEPPSPDSNYISTGGPNTLEAYRMWNAQCSHDIVLKKNVTGNLGDRTKQFAFTVTLTGLESEKVYTTSTAAGVDDISSSPDNKTSTGDSTTANVILQNAASGTIASDGKSFTSSPEGKAEFLVTLRDDETLVINALPRSASYQITEAKSDHVPQYTIESTNKASAGSAAVIEKKTDSTGRLSNETLATETEIIDRYDGTVVITYENNRDLATVTGIAGLDYMVYALVILALVLSTAAIIRRKKIYAEEEY